MPFEISQCFPVAYHSLHEWYNDLKMCTAMNKTVTQSWLTILLSGDLFVVASAAALPFEFPSLLVQVEHFNSTFYVVNEVLHVWDTYKAYPDSWGTTKGTEVQVWTLISNVYNDQIEGLIAFEATYWETFQ